jgi:hypothetical protein
MPIQAAKVRFRSRCPRLSSISESQETAPRYRLTIDALGPCLPVDLTTCCAASLPKADVGQCCSNLAPHVTALWTNRPLALVAQFMLAVAARPTSWAVQGAKLPELVLKMSGL